MNSILFLICLQIAGNGLKIVRMGVMLRRTNSLPQINSTNTKQYKQVCKMPCNLWTLERQINVLVCSNVFTRIVYHVARLTNIAQVQQNSTTSFKMPNDGLSCNAQGLLKHPALRTKRNPKGCSIPAILVQRAGCSLFWGFQLTNLL